MNACAGFGLREEDIVKLIINPATGNPISPMTLRTHFRRELDQGHVVATSKVAAGLFKNATTATERHPGGLPVAQIFWMKTRGRWRQMRAEGPEPPPLPPAQDGQQADIVQAARRILFALELGASALQPAAKPKVPA